MNVSHVLVKVSHLSKAVETFRSLGFVVEYGREKDPYNALIYFSKGPYLELLANTGMPSLAKKGFRILGKGRLVDRLDGMDHHAPGPCDLALENYRKDLKQERDLLKRQGIALYEMNAKRTDPKGRTLGFRVGFPEALELPFFMTYFDLDPKPKNFVHPNGVERIQTVEFGIPESLRPLLEALCTDPTLRLTSGKGVGRISLLRAPGTNAGRSDLAPELLSSL
ncbi:hypothetical protein ABB02_01890 [Clostridiaceae bacterium JG1575]|nr:hypothetical protein ABB02_01890 [Clostridiaceae bacterium JG1575]